MPNYKEASHSSWQRYAVAVGCAIVALLMILLREGPAAELKVRLLLLAAVMLSSWYGGLRPGIVTTLIAGAAITYSYSPSGDYFRIDMSHSVRLVEFVIVALLITYLNDRQRKVQERAEIAQKEAERANRAKDEFLGTVSHELRTPLSAVLGWTHVLLTEQNDQALSTRALEAIERNARKQLQLIEDLLDVSHINAGQFRLEVDLIDLSTVIDAAIDVVRPAIDAKGLQLKTNLAEFGPSIFGDERRLQQALWNLLSNAVKFTPAGGLIEIHLEYTDFHARVVVKDTGNGIDPELLPHVFERFRQGHQSRSAKHGGLGLGLSIAHHLVELHGGTIEVSSGGEGQGAEFIIRLPLENAIERLMVEQHQIAAVSVGL
jgi:two-component system CheB/CheR fusion protein